ncbi:MAG: proton-conducting membrane transporter, partial [Lachnospiraceae bacterium]|nr:proton-conducting membrane transporter [Lachnospiraceae bacterium]
MREMIIALLPILLPILMGTILLFLKNLKERKVILTYTGTGLLLTGVLAWNVILNATDRQVTLFWLTERIPVMLKLDALGRVFLMIVTVVWICAGFFSFSYMKHEKNERRYYGFFLITFGVLMGL